MVKSGTNSCFRHLHLFRHFCIKNIHLFHFSECTKIHLFHALPTPTCIFLWFYLVLFLSIFIQACIIFDLVPLYHVPIRLVFTSFLVHACGCSLYQTPLSFWYMSGLSLLPSPSFILGYYHVLISMYYSSILVHA